MDVEWNGGPVDIRADLDAMQKLANGQIGIPPISEYYCLWIGVLEDGEFKPGYGPYVSDWANVAIRHAKELAKEFGRQIAVKNGEQITLIDP